VPGHLSPYWWTLATALAPLGGIGFLVLPALPFVLSRVRWRFDADAHVFEYIVAVAGIPVRRRRIPLADVVRMEVRDDEVNMRLVLVLNDGSSLELIPSVEDDPLAWRRVRALARGVQVHTGVHVTSALRMDPDSCEKRLVALKAEFAQVASRAKWMSRVSTATAFGLGAAFVVGSGSPFALMAMAVLAAGHVGARTADEGTDSPFLKDGLVRPSALPELERQVQALQMSRAGASAYVAGSAALVGVAMLWAATGVPTAAIALLVAAMGSAASGARWARVHALQKLLPAAEMGKDEKSAATVSAEIGEVVDHVRRAILVEQTRQKISELRWQLSLRKSGGFHSFLVMVSTIVFLLAQTQRGTAAMVVELLAGVAAMYGAFVSANLMKWKATGKAVGEVEGELKELLEERRLLSLPPVPALPAPKSDDEGEKDK
jgi:hypothetical protein